MLTNIPKWVNSHGIQIPESVMSELNLSSEQPVEFIIEDENTIIKKAGNKRKNIQELFENYTGDYSCSEFDWGE